MQSARLITVASFFRQTTGLTLYLPLFMHCALLPKALSTWFWTHPKPLKNHSQAEGSSLSNFLALWDSPPFSALWDFFSKSFFVAKGSPIHFFDILQLNGCWKSPKGLQNVHRTRPYYSCSNELAGWNVIVFRIDKPKEVLLTRTDKTKNVVNSKCAKLRHTRFTRLVLGLAASNFEDKRLLGLNIEFVWFKS